jgi:hypothetical protein
MSCETPSFKATALVESPGFSLRIWLRRRFLRWVLAATLAILYLRRNSPTAAEEIPSIRPISTSALSRFRLMISSRRRVRARVGKSFKFVRTSP